MELWNSDQQTFNGCNKICWDKCCYFNPNSTNDSVASIQFFSVYGDDDDECDLSSLYANLTWTNVTKISIYLVLGLITHNSII